MGVGKYAALFRILQDNSKSPQWICMKFFRGVGCVTMNNPLDFGCASGYDLDAGIFFKDFDQPVH